jgi:hypothetical protein
MMLLTIAIIALATLYLARFVSPLECVQDYPTKDVCVSNGKCYQYTDFKKDALRRNGFCWEQKFFYYNNACWEKMNWYYCSGSTACYAKKEAKAMTSCPSSCSATPHVHVPLGSSTCYKLLEEKVNTATSTVLYLNGACYEKRNTGEKLIIYNNKCWERRDNWFQCAYCYGMKQECSGGGFCP